MKKVILFFIIINSSLFGAHQKIKESRFIKMQFDSYRPDDNYFIFKLAEKKSLICRPYGLKMINLMENPKCIQNRTGIKEFNKSYKKAIQKIIKPGKRFYVKIKSKVKNYYLCDISTNKKNIRLELVKYGFAAPTEDNKILFDANLKAKNEKIGMYSDDFEDITRCILLGVNSSRKEEVDNNEQQVPAHNPNIESIPINKSLPKIQIEILGE